MPRGKSGNKHDGDLENTLGELEVARLEKSCRILECDRTAYQNETTVIISHQQQEIQQLLAEKESIEKDMRLSESQSNQAKDEKQRKKIEMLIQERKDLEAELEIERAESKRISEEIAEFERKGKQQRKIESASKNDKKIIKTLENQLDHTLKKFNTQLAKNREMREEITSLKHERTRFDGINRKLEKYNDEIRKEMGEVIQQSNSAYEVRDEAQNRIILLKDKADKDRAQHLTEMRELQRVIDHDRQLKDFMNIKTQEREEDELTKKAKRKKEEQAAKRAKDPAETVRTYENAIEEMRTITSEDDLDDFVRIFIENEDKNFSLFELVNEQNNQIDNLKKMIEQKEIEKEEFKNDGKRLEIERQNKLHELEFRQKAISKQAEEDEEKVKSVEKILDQLKSGVDSLFKKIDCPRSKIDQLLGPHEEITNDSLMMYLGIIEEETNRLLAKSGVETFKDPDSVSESQDYFGLLGGGPQPPAQTVTVLPPSTGDDYEHDSDGADDDVRPFSTAELKAKIMRTVQKKEQEFPRQRTLGEMQTFDKSKKDKKGVKK